VERVIEARRRRQLELGMVKSLGRVRFCETTVEGRHQHSGGAIRHRPQRDHHPVGAGVEEGPGEPHQAFPRELRAKAGLTAGEHYQLGTEREVEDLEGLQQTVAAGRGSEDQTGVLG